MTARVRYCKRPRHEGGECKLHQGIQRRREEQEARWRALVAARALRRQEGRPVFHNDSQNVHRTEVTVHTNSLRAELATDADTEVLVEIEIAWKDKTDKSRVIADM